MMNMYDGVRNIPMTYRDTPIICTFVVVVATLVKYLPSKEGVLKYCNFRRYSRCIVLNYCNFEVYSLIIPDVPIGRIICISLYPDDPIGRTTKSNEEIPSVVSRVISSRVNIILSC